MNLKINGERREFPELGEGSTLAGLVSLLGIKADRIAIEHNGDIARRDAWNGVLLRDHDKLEIVHFVGGGSPVA